MLKPTHGEYRDFVTDEMQQGSGSVMPPRLLGCCPIVRWEKQKGKKRLYFLNPGVPRLLMLEHKRYSWSERISYSWIYYFNFLDTFALLGSAWWSNMENDSRRGLPHMCGTVQWSQAISGALWDTWPPDPQNNSFGTALSYSLMPFISVFIHFFCILIN